MTLLTDPFPAEEVLHFQGRGGKTFDYIEDETVMDRLDEVVGPGNWSVKVEPISLAEGVVKVTLEVAGAVYEDFGYQNREDGEALKEAVSDGIRRVGRMAGVGRYLYRKHESTSTRGASSPRAVQAPAVVPPAAGANPYNRPRAVPEDPYPESMAELDGGDPLVCSVHGTPWIGSPGDLWHGPKGVVEGGYCRHPDNKPKGGRR